jgi:hypothetical protein
MILKFRYHDSERYIYSDEFSDLAGFFSYVGDYAEQSTGLFDMHGTEIYEGDFLSFSEYPDDTYLVDMDNIGYLKSLVLQDDCVVVKKERLEV